MFFCFPVSGIETYLFRFVVSFKFYVYSIIRQRDEKVTRIDEVSFENVKGNDRQKSCLHRNVDKF